MTRPALTVATLALCGCAGQMTIVEDGFGGMLTVPREWQLTRKGNRQIMLSHVQPAALLRLAVFPPDADCERSLYQVEPQGSRASSDAKTLEFRQGLPVRVAATILSDVRGRGAVLCERTPTGTFVVGVEAPNRAWPEMRSILFQIAASYRFDGVKVFESSQLRRVSSGSYWTEMR